jgi:16S rRNA (cytosine967-C5)-methyltransferase
MTDSPAGESRPGFLVRRIAADVLENVLHRRRPLDEQLNDLLDRAEYSALPDHDRALLRALAATVLRHLGTLRHLLARYLDRGLPASPRAQSALLIGAAQILWFAVPDYAAVDIAVELARSDRKSVHYAGLINAVLRRIIREGRAELAKLDTTSLDVPDWLLGRWMRHYGADVGRAIAAAHGQEPALDFTVRTNPQLWAEKLGGRVLPTGSVRAAVHGNVAELPGYAQGAWWIQDAAAALPVRLLGRLEGRTVADLCAAPGGKTTQLAAAAAQVIALDRSARRLERVRQNLARLNLQADIVQADVLQWRAGPFDAVLLDAPCSGTGTIRRHPDIPWIKRPADITALAAAQRDLLGRAAELVKPGGLLVYCTCSLEPEESTQIIGDFLTRDRNFRRRPIQAGEADIAAEWLTPEGELRTLPCHLPDPEPAMAGLDGFYAARLERVS